jgi:hypothetical protein
MLLRAVNVVIEGLSNIVATRLANAAGALLPQTDSLLPRRRRIFLCLTSVLVWGYVSKTGRTNDT